MSDQRNSRKRAVANVIKQANQQVALGDIQSATDILLTQIAGKKHKDWKKEYEQLMLRLFELCVERRDTATAKDAIHNYRNMCQHHDPNSLDIVVTHMFNIAERKLDAALRSCQVIEGDGRYFQTSLLDEEDEEAKEGMFGADPFAPETLLLSAVGVDEPPSLYQREQVMPWSQFLFNVYRGLLDALQRNIKLERVYHNAAQRLFKVCIKYKRSSDLHRLTDLLRNHFTKMGEYMARQAGGRGGEVEWSMTTLNLQLESRLYLLEAFCSTGASRDAVRVIPQVAEIIRLSEGDLPSRSQARRFLDCAAKVYLENGNYLLHACCLIELQSLCASTSTIDHSSLPDYALRENAYWSVSVAKTLEGGRKLLPTSELPALILVACLAIPTTGATLFGGASTTDEAAQQQLKTQATSYLLGLRFSQPSREVVLSHLMETGLVSSAPEFA
jgi:translation initiation factor 3 subunit A